MQRCEAEITRALAQAQTVYAALRGAAVPGATELALEAAVRQAAGEHEIQFDLLSGSRTAQVEGGATARALHYGDPVLLDLCLRSGDHWCDVCRTYFLGKANADLQKAYGAVRECLLLLEGLARDGVQARSLYGAARAFLAERGMDGWVRHHMGHGIGRTPFQPPVLLPDSEATLRSGDVVTIEIGVYNGSAFGIRLENDYRITDTGAQNLWGEPESLPDVILPWSRGSTDV